MQLELRRSSESLEKPSRDARRDLDKQVNMERDERLAQGFWFEGNMYDFGPQSALDIAGAGATALEAKSNGAEKGKLDWDDGAPFFWRTADNKMISMDAHTVWEFSQAARRHRQRHVYAASRLKDSDALPENWKDDVHWPAVRASGQ